MEIDYSARYDAHATAAFTFSYDEMQHINNHYQKLTKDLSSNDKTSYLNIYAHILYIEERYKESLMIYIEITKHNKLDNITLCKTHLKIGLIYEILEEYSLAKTNYQLSKKITYQITNEIGKDLLKESAEAIDFICFKEGKFSKTVNRASQLSFYVKRAQSYF